MQWMFKFAFRHGKQEVPWFFKIGRFIKHEVKQKPVTLVAGEGQQEEAGMLFWKVNLQACQSSPINHHGDGDCVREYISAYVYVFVNVCYCVCD